MHRITRLIVFICVGSSMAAPSQAVAADHRLQAPSAAFVAEDAPCTEYQWEGKALVKGFDGDLHELISRGTVCAHSRDEARKLAHEDMYKYASSFGHVIYCGADIG